MRFELALPSVRVRFYWGTRDLTDEFEIGTFDFQNVVHRTERVSVTVPRAWADAHRAECDAVLAEAKQEFLRRVSEGET